MVVVVGQEEKLARQTRRVAWQAIKRAQTRYRDSKPCTQPMRIEKRINPISQKNWSQISEIYTVYGENVPLTHIDYCMSMNEKLARMFSLT
jgi:hypothetical protein